MSNPKSDTSENATTSHKAAVREFLRTHGEVASKDQLRAGTDMPAWDIDQIASEDLFYTSLNYNGEYVASKFISGRTAACGRPPEVLDRRVRVGLRCQGSQ